MGQGKARHLTHPHRCRYLENVEVRQMKNILLLEYLGPDATHGSSDHLWLPVVGKVYEGSTIEEVL